MMCGLCLFFFFQAEDGIRDLYVTGVQTCALPIFGEAGKARRRGIVGAIPRRSNAASVVETPPNLVTDFGFGTLADSTLKHLQTGYSLRLPLGRSPRSS